MYDSRHCAPLWEKKINNHIMEISSIWKYFTIAILFILIVQCIRVWRNSIRDFLAFLNSSCSVSLSLYPQILHRCGDFYLFPDSLIDCWLHTKSIKIQISLEKSIWIFLSCFILLLINYAIEWEIDRTNFKRHQNPTYS
jgi:hypothetical protein